MFKRSGIKILIFIFIAFTGFLNTGSAESSENPPVLFIVFFIVGIIILICVFNKFTVNWTEFRNLLLSLKSLDYFPVSKDDENFLSALQNFKPDNFHSVVHEVEAVSQVEENVTRYICAAKLTPVLEEEKDLLGDITGVYLNKERDRNILPDEEEPLIKFEAKTRYRKGIRGPNMAYINAIRTPTLFIEVSPTGIRDIIIIQNRAVFLEIGTLPSNMTEVKSDLSHEFQKLFLVSTTGEPSDVQISSDIQEILVKVAQAKFLQFKTHWFYALRICPEGWSISSTLMLKEKYLLAMLDLADELRLKL